MLLETSTLPIHGKHGTVERPYCVVFFEEEYDKASGLGTVRLCFTDDLYDY